MPGFVFFVLAVVGAVIYIAVQQQKKTNAEWEQASRTLRLHFQPGNMFGQRRMQGRIDGVQVVVENRTTGGGKSSKTITCVVARHRQPPDGGLRLSYEGIGAGLSKMFGAQDVQTGDASFDDAVMVKAKDERRALAWLTPARRQLVRDYLSSHKGAVIDGSTVTWTRDSGIRDARTLVLETRRAVELVQALESPDGVAVAVAELAAAPEEVAAPAPLVVPLALGDGRSKVAPPPLPGADAEEVAVVEQAGAPDAARPEAETETETKHEPEQEPDTSLTAAAVCEDLFGGSVSSATADKAFAERYAGRTVRWSGKLRSADAFSYDFVFGNQKGTKATFEVHRLQANAYLETWVLAVVALPPELHAELRDRRGATFTFAGTLKKVESFAKSLYVCDGRIAAADRDD